MILVEGDIVQPRHGGGSGGECDGGRDGGGGGGGVRQDLALRLIGGGSEVEREVFENVCVCVTGCVVVDPGCLPP